MKKAKIFRVLLMLIVTFLLMKSDYSFAQTVQIPEDDDPGYWKANGYFDNGDSINEYSVEKYGVRNEDDEDLEVKLGADISKYNGKIDWEKAKEEGIEYAIIRVGYRGYSYGTLAEDPYYKENIQGALDAEIPVGVYIFSQAITEKEAIEEANYILKRICDYKITLPVVMDFEYASPDPNGGRLFQANLSVEEATKVCKAFLKTVKKAGYTPMLYANKYMLTSKLDAEEIEKDYKIWLAHYTTETDYEGIYDFWQFTSDGDGYKYGMETQRLDLNYWYDDGSIRGRVYRIKYVLDGGKNNKKNPMTYRNSEVVLKAPTKKGYVFRGWYTDKNFENQIEVIQKGTKKDYKLYAKWELEVKPTHIELNHKTVRVVKGTTYALEAVVYPENVSFDTVTWTSSNEKVATVDENGVVTAVKHGTATITAIADGDKNITKTCKVIVPYNIVYELDGGENNIENPSAYYKEEVVLKEPVKDGYVFKGWYTDKNFENEITQIEKGTKKNYTLYAKWKEIVSVEEAEITLSNITCEYTGKQKKPSVKVVYNGEVLEKNKDYTIQYENNINIGKAVATIIGKGDYNGMVQKTFTIQAKKGKIVTLGEYKYKITSSSAVAFAGIKSTKTRVVVIPKTVEYGGKKFKVTAVAASALKKQVKVTSVTLGAYVKKIGVSAFEGCKKLSEVKFKTALTTIEDKAFKNCTALKNIRISSNVSKIDKQAFYGCKNLKTIVIRSENLTTVGKDALKKINSTATIGIEKENYQSYKELLKDKGQGSTVKYKKIK